MSVQQTPSFDLNGRLAILHLSAATELGVNPFGKDVANLQLWQAMARHAGFARLDVMTAHPVDRAAVAAGLLGDSGAGTEIFAEPIQGSRAPREAGALFRGQPDLANLAWTRRQIGSDRAYSLIGMIHTLAPPTIRQTIANGANAPLFPWDALICPSPAVRSGVETMLRQAGEHMAERTGGQPPPLPSLPIIPLGVDAARFANGVDRPHARGEARRGLGLAEDDILVLWVGRLSYYEKAFPQPMFKACQIAAAATGARVTFVMAGWFPNDGDRAHFETAAREQAPDVDVRFVDGNDQDRLLGLWAGADVFISLADNIQETFGITPLEAMASGVPAVVSDWDGYSANVRDGIDGFLIPTLGGPAGGGMGQAMLDRHVIGAASYQAYVGSVAQHTAVHIGRAGEAIAELIRSPDLRRRMGQAGRQRIRDTYDWPVVARQIHGLTDELAAIRAAAAEPELKVRLSPVNDDPFRTFAPFASIALTLETRLTATPGVDVEALRTGAGLVSLDQAFGAFRSDPEVCAAALQMLVETGGSTVREVLIAFPVAQRRALETGLAWMAKYGFVDWLT